MKFQLRCVLFLLLPLCMLAGCTRNTVVGIYQSQDKIALVQKGNMGEADITKIMGTPTIVGDDHWYYIVTTIRSRPFMRKNIVKQQMLLLTFNKQSKLCSGIEVMDDNFNNSISPYSGMTKQDFINPRGLVQEYFYCMGKHTKAKKKKQKSRST